MGQAASGQSLAAAGCTPFASLLWFTNWGGGSIGRIDTKGKVTIYEDASIDFPEDITVGPDGALWFTNDGDSIGRITTKGEVSIYRHAASTAPRESRPARMALSGLSTRSRSGG